MNFDVKKDCPLLDFVREKFPDVSTTKAKKMILYNCFSLRGASIKSMEYMLKKGDTIEYRKYSGGKRIAKEKREISVLYEDKNILIVNKSFNQKVFDPKDRKNEDMLSEVKRYVRKRERSANVYIVFAPNTYESGLCIFAKNKYVYQTMTENADNITFDLSAIVCNRPKHKNDKITFFFQEDKGKYTFSPICKEGYQTYTFKYTTLEDLSQGEKSFFLLHITHQGYKPLLIRFFLKQMGCPVVGDINFDEQKVKNILKFHYSSLTFKNILNGKETSVTTQLPKTFKSFNTSVE